MQRLLLLLLLLLFRCRFVTGLFSLVHLLLHQRLSPPLRLQVSDYCTRRIMCDVPRLAASCSESIERFPGMASKFCFKLFVNIPVASVIFGLIIHSIFHIRCISIHKLLYFSLFSASFYVTFLYAGIAISISVHVYCCCCYYYYYYYLDPVVGMSLLKIPRTISSEETPAPFCRRLVQELPANYWCSCIRFLLSSPFIYSARFKTPSLVYCQSS